MSVQRAFNMQQSGTTVGTLHLAVKDSLPVVLGLIPFGITCGIMGLTAGLNSFETVLMSLLVFAGAAQFICLTMLAAGVTEFGIIIFTTFLVNLRHFIMGAYLAPYMIKLPIPLQALLSFGMVDESYALTANHIHTNGYSPRYQFTTSAVLYVAWVTSTAVGVALGRQFSDPLSWGLDFAMPATFLVMLIPRLVNRTSIYVCLVAGSIAVLGALYLPGKWYIIIACLVASLMGSYMERKVPYAH